ncbi:MAG: hypothetical protein MZV70_29565 [Desulfobacterales bacterium]|nr:hypothetical protein [Desulfobacterales bacterium]
MKVTVKLIGAVRPALRLQREGAGRRRRHDRRRPDRPGQHRPAPGPRSSPATAGRSCPTKPWPTATASSSRPSTRAVDPYQIIGRRPAHDLKRPSAPSTGCAT